MQSTSPPPPPPYASKHTIIAAPPAVSNRSGVTPLLSPTSKSPSPDPSGHRVSTALNITFSPPPASDGNCAFEFAQPRRHVVQRVSTPPSPPVNTSGSSQAALTVSVTPAEWKPGRLIHHRTLSLAYSRYRCRLMTWLLPMNNLGNTHFLVHVCLFPPSTSDALHHHPVVLRRSPSSATATSNPSTSSYSYPTLGICSKCGSRITNVATACQALGCFYHDKCFDCCICQRTLRGKTFYKDQDKIYCEEDYLCWGFQQMAEKCTVCDHIIAQTIVRAMGKSYHPGCFRCTICNKGMEEEPFTVDQEGHIFCLYDFYLATAPTCAACANPILPESTADEVLRVVAMNKEFHIECYRCEDCGLLLSNEVSSRCYPYVETEEGETPGRTHLLCLKCHLARIGATPAPGQNLDALPLQHRRRSSNGSSSLASSCDLGVPGSVSLTHSSGSGERSSPYSTERRTVSKPWSSTVRQGYYSTESDGR
ncbi:Wilms tumor protein 1-interacting protein [Echinococcus granulosus]|uniref:Wilms tumor protein 1-interacting protein n=1 Tax=Echinococcus granulosus TaxID=6210 RepID=W6UTW2_ECHGR|nr:Wilms tumor protein 1-interacting protein [Echinococcus granulosus]EUB56839.1 Wilms tumor protein 1-interacting protein [Echinococcus granulosus]